LVGAVYHDDYTLATQAELDCWALAHGLLRPETYKFDDIVDLLSKIDLWTGKEGVCVYSQNDQQIHKIKSAWYLVRHRLKEEFSNIEKIVDFYISENCPSFTAFQTRIASIVDWETANEIQGDVSRICDAWKTVTAIVLHMKSFVEPLKSVSRKEAAQKITSAYGITNRASFCFSLLDGKELTSEQLKKILWQSLKE
jgi:hypothetical protein